MPDVGEDLWITDAMVGDYEVDVDSGDGVVTHVFGGLLLRISRQNDIDNRETDTFMELGIMELSIIDTMIEGLQAARNNITPLEENVQ